MSVAAAPHPLTAVAKPSVSACRQPIFLDFQATPPLDPLVLEAMSPRMKGAQNAHAVEHSIGCTAADAVDEAREKVAAMLGCQRSEVTFTSEVTEASDIVLRGSTPAGDYLAISATEDASVMATAKALEADGRTVSRITVSDDGILDLDALEATLAVPTTLASIVWVNNEIGTVQPIEEAAELCSEPGVPLHTDMTQAPGRIPVCLRRSSVAYGSIVDDDPATNYVALRADENRSGYISHKPNIMPIYPFQEDGLRLADIEEIVRASGVGVSPSQLGTDPIGLFLLLLPANLYLVKQTATTPRKPHAF